MEKIKKLFFFIIINLILTNYGLSEINNRIIVSVNDDPITNFDLIEEIKTLNVMTGGALLNAERNYVRKTAIESLINRSIKQREIEKFDIKTFSQTELNNQINTIVNRFYGNDINNLRIVLEKNEMKFKDLTEKFKNDLKWVNLIFDKYGKKIKISDQLIDKRLEEIKNNQYVTKYLLSEIVIEQPANDTFENEIEKIKKKIESNGFKNTALEFSVASSASNLGELGWINEGSLSNEYRSIISKLKVGQVSKPIKSTEGMIIFKLDDKKTDKIELDLKIVRENILSSEMRKKINVFSRLYLQKLKKEAKILTY